MLRIRSSDGQVVTLPANVRFVEIASPDMKVGAVVFMTEGGVVRVLQPGDADFEQYAQAYRVEVARRIKVPDTHFKVAS